MYYVRKIFLEKNEWKSVKIGRTYLNVWREIVLANISDEVRTQVKPNQAMEGRK